MNSSGCWKVRANPSRALAAGVRVVTSFPAMKTRPATGRRSPEMTPKSVDLPAPFGPTRPTMLLAGTSMDTSDNAVRPPNRTVTPVADNTVSGERATSGAIRSDKIPPDDSSLLDWRDLVGLGYSAYLVPDPEKLACVLRHRPIGVLGDLHRTESEEDRCYFGVGRR